MIEQRIAEGNPTSSLREPLDLEARTAGSERAVLEGDADAVPSAWEGYSLETLTSLLDS